jgi:hypothetical protein
VIACGSTGALRFLCSERHFGPRLRGGLQEADILTYHGGMSRHTIKRTTVRLPAELLRTAQRKAAAEGKTLTGLMEEGLRYVVGSPPQHKTKRPEIPVSKEGGGHAPGFTTFKEIEEQEDLEYIERLNRGFK